MPKYSVMLPVTGELVFSGVEADSEEEAIETAMSLDIDHGELSWSTIDTVVKGNVFRGERNEAEAVETDDE